MQAVMGKLAGWKGQSSRAGKGREVLSVHRKRYKGSKRERKKLGEGGRVSSILLVSMLPTLQEPATQHQRE